jgi:Na+-translocating ferredoxin:NAD+ oxidoreductase RNF subunit RnfB
VMVGHFAHAVSDGRQELNLCNPGVLMVIEPVRHIVSQVARLWPDDEIPGQRGVFARCPPLLDPH